MNFTFNKEHWIRDKEYFKDEIDLDVELMDKVKDYFFGFMDSPVDIYLGQTIKAYSRLCSTEDELISYLKENIHNKVRLVLYCILRIDGGIVLRTSILK